VENNTAINITVDESELDRVLELLSAAIGRIIPVAASVREKLKLMEELDGLFRRSHNSPGVELEMHNAPTGGTGDCFLINHPTQSLLEFVSTMRTYDRLRDVKVVRHAPSLARYVS
jgi:hypothetical protein